MNKAANLLRSKIGTLRVLEPLTASESPIAAQISGRTFYCDKNEDGLLQIRLDFRDDVCLFNLRDDRGDHEVKCGMKEWIESFTTITGDKLHHEYQPDFMRVVAGGTWKDNNTLQLTWQFTESSFRDTVVCRFRGKAMSFDRGDNVNSGPLTRATVVTAQA